MSVSNLLVPNHYNLNSNSLTMQNLTANPGGADTLWDNSNFSPSRLFKGAVDIQGGSAVVNHEFYAFPLAVQAVATGVATTLTYVNAAPTHPYNLGTGGNLVAATGIWTCPEAGLYLFCASCTWQGGESAPPEGTNYLLIESATPTVFQIAINQIRQAPSDGTSNACSGLMRCTLAQTVKCTIGQDYGAPLNCKAVYFSGVMISA